MEERDEKLATSGSKLVRGLLQDSRLSSHDHGCTKSIYNVTSDVRSCGNHIVLQHRTETCSCGRCRNHRRIDDSSGRSDDFENGWHGAK